MVSIVPSESCQRASAEHLEEQLVTVEDTSAAYQHLSMGQARSSGSSMIATTLKLPHLLRLRYAKRVVSRRAC